ncbi:unnamed protein product [Phytophthora fragariaefolia]|uniref:Unnamed protein product n=1 Tax=Phytophthora fragariaefolia TaxID=1490495 RepID=A0A9W6X342_9STRA|nr:unnamed protein product [Phytophthora fragariaefolia]
MLSDNGALLTHLDIPGHAAVTVIGDTPVPVESKLRLDLRFMTPGGPLKLRNRLGYSPEKLLANAQQVSSEWDIGDVEDNPGSKCASIRHDESAARANQRRAQFGGE